MRVSSFTRNLFVVGMAVVAAGCATEVTPGDSDDGKAPRRDITVTDCGFNPDQISVTPGETLHVVVHNAGTTAHSIAFAFPGHEEKLEHAIPPGKDAGITVTIPKGPGFWEFYSPIGGDRRRGLIGRLETCICPGADGGSHEGHNR